MAFPGNSAQRAAVAGAVMAAGMLYSVKRGVWIVNMIDQADASLRTKTRKKPPSAVVLHQMAFSRGSDPRRYLGVKAQYAILPDGTTVQLHPWSARLSASHGFNDSSVSVEFAGNLPNENGKWWKGDKFGRDLLTRSQVAAGRLLLVHLRLNGIKDVYAHRQSSASRANDPGPDVWKTVGEFGVKILRMGDGGRGFAIGDGKPIPESWRAGAARLRQDG